MFYKLKFVLYRVFKPFFIPFNPNGAQNGSPNRKELNLFCN